MATVNTQTFESEEKKNGKIKGALIGCVLAGCLAIGGVSAYLTDTETIVNKLSVDTNFGIALTEPNWDTTDADDNGIPDAYENLTAAQQFAKDPTITNDGTVDGYVAATIKVPVFSGKVLGDDGKVVEVTDADLFSYTLGSGWTQQGEATVADGYRTYTYVYSDMLTAGQAATPVFANVTVANLAEGITTTTTQIDVTAHGIQAYGFDNATDAYKAYVAQQAAGVSVGD